MRDSLEIGTVPCGESCQQVGFDSYDPIRARAECRAYADQLWRMLEHEKGMSRDACPDSFSLVVRSNPHDFGDYLEVVAKFDSDDAGAIDLAYWLEGNLPERWDEGARAALKIA